MPKLDYNLSIYQCISAPEFSNDAGKMVVVETFDSCDGPRHRVSAKFDTYAEAETFVKNHKHRH